MPDSVVMVLEAGTDRGCTIARALLAAGYRVVAVDRQASSLVRIGHGHSSDRLLLVAADPGDPDQVERIIGRVYDRFGSAPTLAPCADSYQSSAA